MPGGKALSILLLGLAGIVALPSPAWALERATSDRADDFSGARVHVFYAVPADVADRSLDTGSGADSIPGVIQEAQDFLAAKLAIGLRIDSYQGQPDITFIRLPQPASADWTDPGFLAVLQGQIDSVFPWNGSTINVVMYAGACGGVAYFGPPTAGGHTAFAGVGGPGCELNSKYRVLSSWSHIMVHEIFHQMGIVPLSAPHECGFSGVRAHHVCDDPYDIMYWGGDAPIPTSPQIDVDEDGVDYRALLDPAVNPYVVARVYPHLSISVSGQGEVQLDPPPVRASGSEICAGSCIGLVYRPGTAVTMTPVPTDGAAQATFTGWTAGPCAGQTGPCTFTVTGDVTAAATFKLVYTLAISVKGKGKVVVSGAGTCPPTCSYDALENSQFTLTPRPARGYRFKKWTGCNGRSRCTVTMDDFQDVTALFKKKPKRPRSLSQHKRTFEGAGITRAAPGRRAWRRTPGVAADLV